MGGKVLRWAVFGACFYATTELALRIEQWLIYGAPVLGVYTYDSTLFTTDEHGIRGKPNGRYEKWQLNSFGFRGPEVQIPKDIRRLRIVCLGASETFGLYEGEGKEWPRQLEGRLKQSGVDVEVINAALAGMSLPQRIRHLEKRVLRFRPDVVVFMLEYGSYAGLTPERLEMLRRSPGVLPDRTGLAEGVTTLRVISRLRDELLPKLPRLIKETIGSSERRIKLAIRERELGSKYRTFVHVMPFEISILREDLNLLAATANSAGAKLVLVSPAMWFTERNFSVTYLSWPYIDESWWQEAKALLPPVVREFAESHKLEYLDLSEMVKGHEAQWMEDMLHFNERGAEQVSSQVARAVLDSQRAVLAQNRPK